jgi:citrate synthase
MSANAPAWITAADAARLLGVTRPTLYAYVSRGFVRSQPVAGASRERLYAREDVARLRRRTEERKAPDKAAARALQWGMPILESAITLIDGERLYYRGLDAASLARAQALEDVAALIWTGRMDAAPDPLPVKIPAVRADLAFVPRAQTLLVSAGARDPLAMDLRPARVVRVGFGLLRLMTTAAIGSSPGGANVHRALATKWRVRGRAVDLIRAALVLCADHELNVSAFTARCAASSGTHPYGVVVAALSAFEGPRHGGAGRRVESMLASMRDERSLSRAMTARVRRGDTVEGFGHPLYRDGDPRARLMLEMVDEAFPASAERRFIRDVVRAAEDITGDRPNLDFGLAAVTRVLRLPEASPMALFAIGRTVGWIGQALEQYATGQLIRPRAKYVGVPPSVTAIPARGASAGQV